MTGERVGTEACTRPRQVKQDGRDNLNEYLPRGVRCDRCDTLDACAMSCQSVALKHTCRDLGLLAIGEARSGAMPHTRARPCALHGPWLKMLHDTNVASPEKLSVFDFGKVGEDLLSEYAVMMSHPNLLYANFPACSIMHLDANGSTCPTTRFSTSATRCGVTRGTSTTVLRGASFRGKRPPNVWRGSSTP